VLRRLSLLLALEGLLLIVLGILYGGASLSDHSQRLAAETIAGALVVTGVGLLLIARGVDRTKGWTRSPAVVLNVFPIPIALPLVQAGLWWVGLPVALLGGTVLYLFATPELREAFSPR